MYSQGNNPFKKKKTSKSITWHDSDAPDAKGKFKSLSPSGLASWLIKTRKGKLNRIIGSLNQQYVFNRGKKPSYAAKMKTSPTLAKLSASCKAAAKRKFKVYPSAYANMWASRTQKKRKC